MKLIKEVPFAGMFRDLQGQTKFEASGLVHVNDTYYAVFDRCKQSLYVMIPRRPLHANSGETYAAVTEVLVL